MSSGTRYNFGAVWRTGWWQEHRPICLISTTMLELLYSNICLMFSVAAYVCLISTHTCFMLARAHACARTCLCVHDTLSNCVLQMPWRPAWRHRRDWLLFVNARAPTICRAVRMSYLAVPNHSGHQVNTSMSHNVGHVQRTLEVWSSVSTYLSSNSQHYYLWHMKLYTFILWLCACVYKYIQTRTRAHISNVHV